jgi:hypothetical protein
VTDTEMTDVETSTIGITPRWAASVAVLAVVAALASGCQESQSWREPGPEATFEQFLMHWFKNERARAFEMIVEEDRKVLTEPRDALRKKLGEEGLAERQEMLVAGRVDNPYDIRSMEVKPPLDEKPQAGESVTLDLKYQDGREGTAKLTWTGQRWAIDLPLEAQATSQTP